MGAVTVALARYGLWQLREHIARLAVQNRREKPTVRLGRIDERIKGATDRIDQFGERRHFCRLFGSKGQFEAVGDRFQRRRRFWFLPNRDGLNHRDRTIRARAKVSTAVRLHSGWEKTAPLLEAFTDEPFAAAAL
jgi:hypothetical protein